MIGRNQRAQLLEAGIKPAYRRHVPAAQLDEYRRYYTERGLAFVEQREKLWFQGSGQRIVYVAKEAAVAEELADLERRQYVRFRPGPPLDARVGELLGYPPCCVEAFGRDRNKIFELWPGLYRQQSDLLIGRMLRRAERFDYRLNIVFPRMRNVIEHLPCGLDCEASIGITEAAVEVLCGFEPELRVRYDSCFKASLRVDRAGHVLAYRRPLLENTWIQLAQPRLKLPPVREVVFA